MLVACSSNPTPKPPAYVRVDFPEKTYRDYQPADCPFEFEIPDYAKIEKDSNSCDFIIEFPKYRGEVFFHYLPITQEASLQNLLDDMHKLAYQHQVKASSINTRASEDTASNKYILEYSLEGNVASNFQFCITDSTQKFVRGSLYFRAKPNQDSLQPVLDYIRKDLDRMISSFKWK